MTAQTPSTTLRLALIAHRFVPNDGQGRVNFEVACGAARQGHRITLVTAHCAPLLAAMPNVQVVSVRQEWLPSQLLRDLAFAFFSSVWLRPRREHFDVVQANGFTVWARCDVVTAHFVHTAWQGSEHFPFRGSVRPRALYQRLFTWWNARVERGVFAKARCIVAVSDEVARQIVALGIGAHGSGAPVRVIENGVDTDEFHPGREERASFGLPRHVLLALFAGDIRTERKNLDTTLAALRNLPHLHLAVAGDTRGSPFPFTAERYGIADRVHFLGGVDRMPALMRSVDLFVFPSRYEAHPLVVLEAMASGLPCVLAATVGSASSYRDCLRVLEDPNDVTALAALLHELSANGALRRQLGEAARRRALTLRWERTVAQYLRIYQALAAEGAALPVPAAAGETTSSGLTRGEAAR